MNSNQYIEVENIKELVKIIAELTREGIMFRVVKAYNEWIIAITGY